jgi:hypothetical protein
MAACAYDLASVNRSLGLDLTNGTVVPGHGLACFGGCDAASGAAAALLPLSWIPQSSLKLVIACSVGDLCANCELRISLLPYMGIRLLSAASTLLTGSHG